jgi:starch synthase
MTSLVPFYLKSAYKDEPVFQNARVVYSVYDSGFDGVLSENFAEKARINGSIADELLKPFENADSASLYAGASEYADGIIVGSEALDEKVEKYLGSLDNKPLLKYSNGDSSIAEEYKEFYESLEASAS